MCFRPRKRYRDKVIGSSELFSCTAGPESIVNYFQKGELFGQNLVRRYQAKFAKSVDEHFDPKVQLFENSLLKMLAVLLQERIYTGGGCYFLFIFVRKISQGTIYYGL